MTVHSVTEMKDIFLRLRLSLSLSLFYISLSLFFVFSCQSKSSIVSENFDDTPFITLDLKEEKTYTLDSIHVQSFSFSPLDKNHLIVFSGRGETYDLNLETSEWINLKTKWGKYAAGLRKENFHTDPFQPNHIWIANSNNGLIAYNHSTDTYIEFPPPKPVSTIVFTESAVWIGTRKGLYMYDRSQLTMKLVDKVAEIYIRSITPMGSGWEVSVEILLPTGAPKCSV